MKVLRMNRLEGLLHQVDDGNRRVMAAGYECRLPRVRRGQ